MTAAGISFGSAAQAPEPGASPPTDVFEARALLAKGDARQALDIAERAARARPSDPQPKLAAGEALLALERWGPAEREFEAARKLDLALPAPYARLGDVELRRAKQARNDGDGPLNRSRARVHYERAYERYRAGLKASPGDVECSKGVALVSKFVDSPVASIAAHKAWMAADPSDPAPYASLAQVYIELHRPRDAAALATQAPRGDLGRWVDSVLEISAYLFDAEFRIESLNVLDVAQSAAAFMPAYQAMRARNLALIGRLDEAYEVARRYVEAVPHPRPGDDPDGYVRLLLERLQSAPEIRAAYRERVWVASRPPAAARKVQPKWPLTSFATSFARVIVVALIDAEGRVEQTMSVPIARWDRPDRAKFEDAALQAAGKWRFEPARLGGKPTAGLIIIRFEYGVSDTMPFLAAVTLD